MSASVWDKAWIRVLDLCAVVNAVFVSIVKLNCFGGYYSLDYFFVPGRYIQY
jgi:hypothetical protein